MSLASTPRTDFIPAMTARLLTLLLAWKPTGNSIHLTYHDVGVRSCSAGCPVTVVSCVALANGPQVSDLREGTSAGLCRFPSFIRPHCSTAHVNTS